MRIFRLSKDHLVSRKIKYHSVLLQEMRNSCTSVFPNTCAWEQLEWKKTKKQEKKLYEKSEYGKKYSEQENGGLDQDVCID